MQVHFKKHISVSAQLSKLKMAMAREIEQEMGGLPLRRWTRFYAPIVVHCIESELYLAK